MDISVATRPVRPADCALLRRMWPRLSRETVYRRFHAPIRTLAEDAVRHLVTVDHDARVAVVAVVGGEVVGIARYERSSADPGSAEFAILVEDDWQGVGLGRQLLAELVELAGQRGVHTLTASVQRDNDRVINLVRRLLPASIFRDDDDVLAVESPLPVTDRRVPVPA